MGTADLAGLAMVAVGMFSVDSRGRVWRHREITRGSAVGGREVEIEPRRADTGRSKEDGYLRVQFTVGKTRYHMAAHRLVWMVANQRLIPTGMEVNHKDGNKSNNDPTNLEITTHAGNTMHALHTLGHMKNRKTSGAKLTPEQVIEIRRLCDDKVMSKAAIADHFKVTVKTIRNIANRAKWADIPEFLG